jgi:hypothetical protein
MVKDRLFRATLRIHDALLRTEYYSTETGEPKPFDAPCSPKN